MASLRYVTEETNAIVCATQKYYHIVHKVGQLIFSQQMKSYLGGRVVGAFELAITF